MPEISIIVVTYNSSRVVGDCLAAVRTHCQNLDHEVIVVDNASVDGTPQMVRERFPEVRVVCNDRNVGFAAANNQAIRESNAPYVALLNPDAFLRNPALTILRDYLAVHPEVGVAGPRMNDAEDRPLASAHAFESLATVTVSVLGLHRRLPQGVRDTAAGLLGRKGRTYCDNFACTEPIRVDWVSGACMVVKREAIDQVGLLDEGYVMYMEDEEWCLRLRRAGWQTAFVPEALVTHAINYGPPSRAKTRLLYDASRRYHRLHNRHTYPLIFLLLRSRYLSDMRRAPGQ